MKNRGDMYDFNNAVHESIKRAINETGADCENLTVFALFGNSSNTHCIMAANGEYTANSFLNIITTVFQQCVDKVAENRRDHVSLEEGKFRSYQALLLACIQHGLNTGE